MQVSPIDPNQSSQNASKYNPKAQEQAKAFNDAFEIATQITQIHAAEQMSKEELRKKKDHVEDGSEMKAEEATEESLLKDLDHLKRKLRNTLDHHQRKQLGI